MLKTVARKRPPGGSRKGRPNRATANAREAIGRFVDGNAPRLQAWLEEVYREEGALAALRCFSDLIEYHVPKLARTIVTDEDAKRIKDILWPLPPSKLEQ